LREAPDHRPVRVLPLHGQQAVDPVPLVVHRDVGIRHRGRGEARSN
jgi:hypothetical protein